ncbi:MAG: 4Fe-4S binding protein [Clostridia bacterium]|nr:4Fe-4S binding protein [Clostridia bacterium]
MKKINWDLNNISWKDITPGGIVEVPGSASDTITGEWRSDKPIWDKDKCKQCLICFPVCPDSSINVSEGKMVGIDYDHCKGCGICANQCPFGAIEMVREG